MIPLSCLGVLPEDVRPHFIVLCCSFLILFWLYIYLSKQTNKHTRHTYTQIHRHGRCGFLFMGPEAYDEMGTDVHDCLYTFELHPAAGLPLRPTHVKSAMRLRPPPRFAPTTPSPSSLRVRNGAPRELGGSSEEGLGRFATVTAAGVMENGFDGDGRRGQGKRGSIDHGGGGGDGGGGGGTGGDDAVVGSGGAHRRSSSGPGGVPCEHAQHLAWFLLTSACLSKVHGVQSVYLTFAV